MTTITTTAQLEEIKETICRDQGGELTLGCETWAITYAGGQRGQMSRWPNGRGAVSWGGDSQWGDWSGDKLHLDDAETIVDAEGNANAKGGIESGENSL